MKPILIQIVSFQTAFWVQKKVECDKVTVLQVLDSRFLFKTSAGTT